MSDLLASLPDISPQFPDDRSGVAVLGCGGIAHAAHLPAYQLNGVEVVGVWSLDPECTAGTRDKFPFVQRVYRDADELLADPRVRIVDIATGPEVRAQWIEAAVAAGKHVLAQKPLVSSAVDLARLLPVLDRAEAAGLRVAVNHNGRWAPPWRLATLLLRAGAIGEVVGVTHLHDKPLPPLVGTPFDEVAHMLLADYLVHWLDITGTWLDLANGVTVQASDSRVPGQPPEARNPWSATVSVTAAGGATAGVRIVGNVHASQPGCPFWIHGTAGTLRGSILGGSDRLALDREGTVTELPLSGQWFVDGFAGTMGELMRAIDEGREPENSAASAVRTVRLVLAARDSAAAGGAPVHLAPEGVVPEADRTDRVRP